MLYDKNISNALAVINARVLNMELGDKKYTYTFTWEDLFNIAYYSISPKIKTILIQEVNKKCSQYLKINLSGPNFIIIEKNPFSLTIKNFEHGTVYTVIKHIFDILKHNNNRNTLTLSWEDLSNSTYIIPTYLRKKIISSLQKYGITTKDLNNKYIEISAGRNNLKDPFLEIPDTDSNDVIIPKEDEKTKPFVITKTNKMVKDNDNLEFVAPTQIKIVG